MEKRLYSFSHFMLSGMAKGIQNTHSTVELFNKYIPNPSNGDEVSVQEENDPYSILWDWSLNHKTIISLNAGISTDLDELYFVLQDKDNFYPWASFNEDESLGQLMTSISTVLTEKIYFTASIYRNNNIKFCNYTNKVQCLDTSKETEETLLKLESYGSFSSFEQELVQRLCNYRLAN